MILSPKMDRFRRKDLKSIFPICFKIIGSENWRRILSNFPQVGDSLRSFFHILSNEVQSQELPSYLSDLAALELSIYELKIRKEPIVIPQDTPVINPTIDILEMSCKGLAQVLDSPHSTNGISPTPEKESLLVWRDLTGKIHVEPATDESLLVLKIVEEQIDPREIARQGGIPIGAVEAAIQRAAQKCMIILPPSRIRRDYKAFFKPSNIHEDVLTANVFTLQWHITQQCDLHCKHCYDRTTRSPLDLDSALSILEDFYGFCRSRHVKGQISFTGGNPFLYQHFFRLYRSARDYGFNVAILGNPVTREKLQDILEIRMPEFYQVSLEGLPEHNDQIRGQGHFERTMEFLDILKDLGIYSMVMLTLTKDNMEQVLPLGEILRDRADLFTFNRLAKVGQAKDLELPSQNDYRAFLEEYVEEYKHNPVLALKDNLINAIFYMQGKDLFGGCTGYGCGAAFNFLALLPDGDVHACRKFPSLLGNIFKVSFGNIYDSPIAQRYRMRPDECMNCPIHPVCGGCPAVAYGLGLDVFKDRDPFCGLPDH